MVDHTSVMFRSDEAHSAAAGRRRGRLSLWAEMLLKDFGWVRCFFNTRTAVMSDVYRSSHPLPYQLRRAAEDGVRTVVNLRGMRTTHGSYQLEQEACERNGLTLLQFRMPSRDMPRTEQVLEFSRLLQQIQYPVLFHCKSGADRVGLASALVLMLRGGVEPKIAARQLSLRHGHFSQAKTGMLDYFVQCYAEHYARHRSSLLDWAQRDYDAVELRRQFRTKWWATWVTDTLLRRE